MISSSQALEHYEKLKFIISPARLLENIPRIPSHLQAIGRDLFDTKFNINNNIDYLRSSMDWLRYAQDVAEGGGVSAGYSLYQGWLPPYPETTGYIIPTFLDCYKLTRDVDYLDRAIRMADWLVSIQLESGAFQTGDFGYRPRPVVFDTGQVLLGLVKAYEETRKQRYLEAALLAGNWLAEIQDADGAWRKFEYNETPHAYNTRVAWALLELHMFTHDENHLIACAKNINWALSNQEANGWFRNNGFGSRSQPFLHTIAYVIEGLIECAALMQNKIWLEAAVKPAKVLLREFAGNGNLSGVYNDKWNGMVGYRCLTGDAQISLCWLKLFQLTGDMRYLHEARKMNDSLKMLQDTTSSNRGVKGGIKGSHPIWGGYLSFKYPNWAAKFFCDALMQEKMLKDGPIALE